MRAIMENDEDARQKSCGDGCQPKGDPVGDFQTPDHETPEREVRHQCVGQLPETSAQARALVPGKCQFPGEDLGNIRCACVGQLLSLASSRCNVTAPGLI